MTEDTARTRGLELIRSGWLDEVRGTFGLSYRALAILLDTDGNTVQAWCKGKTQVPRGANARKVADFEVRYLWDLEFLAGMDPGDLVSLTEVAMQMGVGAGTVASWAHEHGLKIFKLDALGVMLLRTEMSDLRVKVRL